jgi:pimeloyl-ACP methyl ester carboxylesterase
MSGIYTSAEGAGAIERRYRGFLADWPVPGERLRVPTRQGETFVMACGPRDAPPVLLLHGSGSNSAMWSGDAAVWSRHLRLYAVDMIGEPGLSAPARPPLDSGAYAEWLDEVLDALGVRSASLVWISLGGWLALDYAIRRPGRADRLALLCPGGIGRQKPGVALAALLLLPFGRWGRRRALRMALGTELPDTPRGREIDEFMLLVQRYFRYRREPLPVFGDEALRGLTVPMLVTLGGRDAMLDSHGTRRRLEAAVPHAEIRWLPEAGHLLPGQTTPILDFLRAPEGVRSPD